MFFLRFGGMMPLFFFIFVYVCGDDFDDVWLPFCGEHYTVKYKVYAGKIRRKIYVIDGFQDNI
jgi:hypothetical protein